MILDIAGEGGIGKSSSLALLAMDWVEGNNPLLQKFDYTFLIQLRHVKSNSPLEMEIIAQHRSLQNILPSHLRLILHGSTLKEIKQTKKFGPFKLFKRKQKVEVKEKVLLLIDGYDEYKRRKNQDIDDIIKNGIGNCYIIITSRPGAHLNEIRRFMSGEVKITGLSHRNIKKCAEHFLGSKEMSEEMLKQVLCYSKGDDSDDTSSISSVDSDEEGNLYHLLRIPILLLMVCMIYKQDKSLPASKTQIIDKMIQLSISRTTLKTLGRKCEEIEDLEHLLCLLGELAWEALQRDSMELLIRRVRNLQAMNPLYDNSH